MEDLLAGYHWSGGVVMVDLSSTTMLGGSFLVLVLQEVCID